jgi:hypothetical protein
MSSRSRVVVVVVAVVLALAASVAARADEGLPPLSLLKRPHAGEPPIDAAGDVSALPGRLAGAAWLPLELTHGYRLYTTLKIDGRDARVLLDTGAERSQLSSTLAHKLGLDGVSVIHVPVKVYDAQNTKIEAYRVNIGTIEVGPVHIHKVQPDVLPYPDVGGAEAIIGYDVLANVDLLFAVDDGLLGVFPPTKGVLTARDNVVRFFVREHAIFKVPFDDAGRDAIDFEFDTGSPFTTMDRRTGDSLKLPFDARYATDIAGVADVAKKSKGAWIIEHMTLGREHLDIGRVLVEQMFVNVLGCNLILKQHTLLSSERGQMHLAPMPIRPATRSKRPDGTECAGGACVSVAIAAQPDGASCLQVHVDRSWAGQRVIAVAQLLDDEGNDAAGGLLVYQGDVGPSGVDTCGDPYGVLHTLGVKPDAKISLLRFHLIDKDDSGCDSGQCLSFTGAVPRRIAPPTTVAKDQAPTTTNPAPSPSAPR